MLKKTPFFLLFLTLHLQKIEFLSIRNDELNFLFFGLDNGATLNSSLEEKFSACKSDNKRIKKEKNPKITFAKNLKLCKHIFLTFLLIRRKLWHVT